MSKPDPEKAPCRCCATVYPPGMNFARPRQCLRAATVFDATGKGYCARHAPEAVAKKEAAKEAERKAKEPGKAALYRAQLVAKGRVSRRSNRSSRNKIKFYLIRP